MKTSSQQNRYRPRVTAAILLFALVIASTATALLQRTAAHANSGFVTRCGIHFCLNGNYYYFAGTNTYDMFTYGDGSSTATQDDIENKYMNKAEIDGHMAALQADHVSVLRLWMFSHEQWHGFEPAKGVYNEAEFDLFDYIVQSAIAHNIKLLPSLENYWTAYGGVDARLQWEGLSTGDANRWKFFNQSQCPGCFTQYKNYVNHVLNHVNHYSGVAYKDEPAIFAWELMNEPRYQNATPNENTTGTTLRAWVDTMGSYIKSIDHNHMVDAGLEGHQSKYGIGGDEGNPFVYIQQSPYIDFTSAHPYPTESWANLTLSQTQSLIDAWNSDSHNVVGKPFFMGEYNVSGVDRSTWWSGMLSEIEKDNADGDAFWWYETNNVDNTYGVMQGAPELAVFRQHSLNMQAKNGVSTSTPTPTSTPTSTPTATPTSTPTSTPTATPTQTTTPTPTPTPVSGVSVTGYYRNGDQNAPMDNQIKPHLELYNTGSSTVNLSDFTIRYWFTIDSSAPLNYWCDYATLGCSVITAKFSPVSPARTGADYYLEIGFTSSAGSLAAGANTGEIQNRFSKADWSNFNETNDYSYNGSQTSYAPWNHITVYYKGQLVWGTEPT